VKLQEQQIGRMVVIGHMYSLHKKASAQENGELVSHPRHSAYQLLLYASDKTATLTNRYAPYECERNGDQGDDRQRADLQQMFEQHDADDQQHNSQHQVEQSVHLRGGILLGVRHFDPHANMTVLHERLWTHIL
jgi:hypothetical protein